MKQLKASLLLVGCAFMLAGFNWPNEKTEKSSKAEIVSKKTEVSHEAPVVHGSDLMEGVVTALDLEAKPAVVTLQFTSGQKTGVEIAKDTTVFRKDQVLGLAELKKGDRLRVEYMTVGTAKIAKNIEIVEVAVSVPVKKTPVKAIAEKVLEPVVEKSAEPEMKDKKLAESEPANKKIDE